MNWFHEQLLLSEIFEVYELNLIYVRLIKDI